MFLLFECSHLWEISLSPLSLSLCLSPSLYLTPRFGEYLGKMVPMIVKFCQTEDDELTEFCLQAFESFVRRCPRYVKKLQVPLSFTHWCVDRSCMIDQFTSALTLVV